MSATTGPHRTTRARGRRGDGASPRRGRFTILALLATLLVVLAAALVYLVVSERNADRGSNANGIVPVRTIDTMPDGTKLERPVGIGAAADGRFAVSLANTQQIALFDENGEWVRAWGRRGLTEGSMLAPLGVGFDGESDQVYVVDRARLRLLAFASDGTFLWETAVLNPLAPVATKDGAIVATFGPLVRVALDGTLVEEVGQNGDGLEDLDYPRGIALAATDELILADSNNARVKRVRFAKESPLVTEWVSGSPASTPEAGKGTFGLPAGVAVDDGGRAYVLDGFLKAIVVVDTATGREVHRFSGIAGSGPGQFNLPTSIAHLGEDRFAIADTYNDRVQIVRLVLPQAQRPLARVRALIWLLPLLFLALWFVLGREHWFVTAEAIERAAAEKRLRLVVAVAKRALVTPEVKEQFAETTEGGVDVGARLWATGEAGDADTAEERLIAALPSGTARLLLPRVRVMCASEEQCKRLAGRGYKVVLLDRLNLEYRIDDVG